MPALVLALGGCGEGAVPVTAPSPGGAAAQPCGRLLADLPERVADQPRREVDPVDAPAAAWGDPPIVLTCDDRPPAGYDRTSSCTTVNGVDWYLPEEQVAVEEPGDVVMTTLNREAFVRVELPAEYWPPAATLVDLASAVTENVPATGRCR